MCSFYLIDVVTLFYNITWILELIYLGTVGVDQKQKQRKGEKKRNKTQRFNETFNLRKKYCSCTKQFKYTSKQNSPSKAKQQSWLAGADLPLGLGGLKPLLPWLILWKPSLAP